jgi:hypothetical protein
MFSALKMEAGSSNDMPKCYLPFPYPSTSTDISLMTYSIDVKMFDASSCKQFTSYR